MISDRIPSGILSDPTIGMILLGRFSILVNKVKKTMNGNQSLQTDLILQKMIDVLNKFEEKIQDKIGRLESKFDQKFDQLSQKVDNLYERGAASSILFHFNTHHYLDAPFSPTSRLFDSHFSEKSKVSFGFFAQEIHKRYSHLWTNIYEQMDVSLRPKQIEVDVLGFAYEKTTNTIMIGEVTTSIIDFDHQYLVQLEQANSKL
ncbi:unnamed protein product [Rotaria socialis]